MPVTHEPVYPWSRSDVPLDEQDRLRLRRALRHLRADRLRDLARQDVATLSDPVHRERLRALRQMLHDIDDAEERLDDGTYGLCARCGAHIGLRRLRQVPYASACSPCLAGL